MEKRIEWYYYYLVHEANIEAHAAPLCGLKETNLHQREFLLQLHRVVKSLLRFSFTLLTLAIKIAFTDTSSAKQAEHMLFFMALFLYRGLRGDDTLKELIIMSGLGTAACNNQGLCLVRGSSVKEERFVLLPFTSNTLPKRVNPRYTSPERCKLRSRVERWYFNLESSCTRGVDDANHDYSGAVGTTQTLCR